MVIACPHCSKPLKLPDDYQGKPVRCPSCQQTFTAPAVEEPTREDPFEEPRSRHDEEEDEELDQARHVARRGAMVLVFAATVTLLARAVGLIAPLIVGTDLPPELQGPHQNTLAFRLGQTLCPTMCGGITIMTVVFMGVGARNLIQMRSRGIVITAGVLALVMAGLDLILWVGGGILGLSIGRNQMTPGMIGLTYVQLFAGLLIFGVDVTAGIMSLIAVNHRDVSHAMQRRGRRRRRRDDDD